MSYIAQNSLTMALYKTLNHSSLTDFESNISRKEALLKKAAYKVAVLGILVLSSIEVSLKSCAYLASYCIYLVSAPFEHVTNKILSILLNREPHSASISSTFYAYAYELSNSNIEVMLCFESARHYLMFEKTHRSF